MAQSIKLGNDTYVDYSGVGDSTGTLAISHDTYTNSAVKSSPVDVYKFGHVVHVASRHDCKALSAGTTNFVTLAQKYRPSADLIVPVANQNEGVFFAGLTTSGLLYIYTSVARTGAANNCAFSFTYVTNN